MSFDTTHYSLPGTLYDAPVTQKNEYMVLNFHPNASHNVRLRNPGIWVVNVDSVASASKIAQGIKFNYTSQQLLKAIKHN